MRKLVVAGLVMVGIVGLVAAPVFAEGSTDGGAAVSVQTIPGESLADIIIGKAATSWPWYIVRAAGLVAALSALVLMLSGIGAVTGHTFRILEPLTAWATHRAIGIVFVLSTIVHIVALLFDKFVPFSVVDVLVPWASDYKPVTIAGVSLGSIYVALGILAFYAIIAIVVTSLLWIDKKQKLWKLLHLASYGVIIAIFLHALFLGTDTGQGWGRLAWIAGGIVLAMVVLVRLRRVSR